MNRERLYMIGFMTLVTAVTIAIVSSLYAVAAPIVERNERLYAMRAVILAAGVQPPESPEALYRVYTGNVRRVESPPLGDGIEDRFVYRSGGDAESGEKWIFKVRGRGLWGTITAMMGVAAKHGFTGVAFMEHNETPGLGARMEEDWFVGQFDGRRGPVRFFGEDDDLPDRNSLNGITGATITTEAVASMANTVWRAFETSSGPSAPESGRRDTPEMGEN